MGKTTLRDISLLPCLYKVFIKCIVERIKSTIIENTVGYWQRAYISKRDRQELIFCLKTAIDDFRHSKSRFYALFVDFRDAFGSISQESLIKSLLECGIEQTYCYIIADARGKFVSGAKVLAAVPSMWQPKQFTRIDLKLAGSGRSFQQTLKYRDLSRNGESHLFLA